MAIFHCYVSSPEGIPSLSFYPFYHKFILKFPKQREHQVVIMDQWRFSFSPFSGHVRHEDYAIFVPEEAPLIELYTLFFGWNNKFLTMFNGICLEQQEYDINGQ